MSETSGKSPIPWLAPEEYAQWQAAYSEELATATGDDGQVLRRAGERTARLRGVRIAPDGTVVLNPDRLPPQIYAGMKAAQQEPETGSRQEIAGPRGDAALQATPAASPGSGQVARGMPAGLDFPDPPGTRLASSPSRRAGQSSRFPASRQPRPGRSR